VIVSERRYISRRFPYCPKDTRINLQKPDILISTAINIIALQSTKTNKSNLKMPELYRTITFTRKGNDAGSQEKVQELANEWKTQGIKVEVNPDQITFTIPPGQPASDYIVKHFRASMEREEL
jgi:hypothetical protein